MDRPRCRWAASDELLARYHDEEWGQPPAHDDGYFECLTLESFQSGLSWATILRKRENFRRAFAEFAPAKVAAFTAADVARLLQDPGIVRHRAKIAAAVHNAQAFLAVQQRHGSFGAFLHSLPPDAGAVHKALAPAFKFLGVTTVQAFLEAVGRVPPQHERTCWAAQG